MIGVLQITNFKCVRSLRLEEWILAAANEAGLDVRAYGLPRTPRQLHGAINTNLDKFERLYYMCWASGPLRDSRRLGSS
jgi:hypothetical protein